MMKVCHRYRLRVVMILMISVGIFCTNISLTNAQTSSVLKKPATALGAVLQPSPSPVHKGVPTNITITFLTLRLDQKDKSTLQPHVDYDATIIKDGKKVFQVSSFARQPGQPLHSDGGIIIFPYTFQQRGVYIATVTVYGILFSPIKPNSVQFPINVT
jgi:hypothetical protein